MECTLKAHKAITNRRKGSWVVHHRVISSVNLTVWLVKKPHGVIGCCYLRLKEICYC